MLGFVMGILYQWVYTDVNPQIHIDVWAYYVVRCHAMEPQEYVLPVLSCHRCEHNWHPKTPHAPQTCPKCKSPYWHTPRRVKAAKPENDTGGVPLGVVQP